MRRGWKLVKRMEKYTLTTWLKKQRTNDKSFTGERNFLLNNNNVIS